MRNNLISALFFFITTITSFAVYEFFSDGAYVILPLFVCLGLGTLAALAIEYKKKLFVK